MSPQNNQPNFSWLFFAGFTDGSFTKQTSEDETPDSNQFKAVLDRRDNLAYFELRHIDSSQTVSVDLKTGNFCVNGTPICIHNQGFNPEKYKLELVYFREKREHQTQKHTLQEDGTVKVENIGDQESYVNRYFIGWKTQVNGRDKQVTLAVG